LPFSVAVAVAVCPLLLLLHCVRCLAHICVYICIYVYVCVYGNYYMENSRVEIRGRETAVSVPYNNPMQLKVWVVENIFMINEEGDRITIGSRYSDGKVEKTIYLWQR